MNGDRSLLVGLGTDSDKLDPNDREAVQAALEPILPGVDVLDCAGHARLHGAGVRRARPPAELRGSGRGS